MHQKKRLEFICCCQEWVDDEEKWKSWKELTFLLYPTRRIKVHDQ